MLLHGFGNPFIQIQWFSHGKKQYRERNDLNSICFFFPGMLRRQLSVSKATLLPWKQRVKSRIFLNNIFLLEGLKHGQGMRSTVGSFPHSQCENLQGYVIKGTELQSCRLGSPGEGLTVWDWKPAWHCAWHWACLPSSVALALWSLAYYLLNFLKPQFLCL